MLTSFVRGTRDSIHAVFRPKPAPPMKMPCMSMSNKDLFYNVIFFSAAIFAPLYYTLLRDLLRKIRSVNYKIVRVKN